MKQKTKENEILNSAMILFSENGFRDTSVQDIAKRCKISKATIYKLFDSKEEILIKVINEINKQIFLEIDGMQCKIQGNKIEKLKKKFTIFLESWHKKREFIAIVYENQSLMKDDKVKTLITNNKIFVINWYKEILIEAYGNSINDRIGDIILILSALIREVKGINNVYSNKVLYEPDFESTAKFIIDTIDIIVENLDKTKPFLKKDIFESVYSSKSITEEIFFNEWNIKTKKIIKDLEFNRNETEAKCIKNSLEELDLELRKSAPRRFFVDSQILYLSNFEIIKKDIMYLENLYIRSDIYNKLS